MVVRLCASVRTSRRWPIPNRQKFTGRAGAARPLRRVLGPLPRTLPAQTSPTNRFGFGPTSAIALLQKALGPSAGAAPFVLINEL